MPNTPVERSRTVASLYRNGANVQTIATELGCSRPTIRRDLRRAGVWEQRQRGRLTLLDRRPLVDALVHYRRVQRVNRDPNYGWGRLAEEAGIDERAIHRIITGESQRVSLRLADLLATTIGIPLALLYPRDDEEAQAA